MSNAYFKSLSVSWLLIPLLLSIYLVTFQGSFQADDEHIFAARAQSLALRGDLEAPQVYGNARVRQLQLWGDQATEVEPALSFIGAGLYWLAARLGLGGLQLMFTINLFAVAGSAYLVYRTGLLFSLEEKFALLTGLGFGLTTFAMPYALTLYRDPLAMLMAALVFYGFALLISTVHQKKTAAYIWIAIGLVGGVLAKNTVLVVLPVLILGWLLFARVNGQDLLAGPTRILLAGMLCLLVLSFLLPSSGILARFSVGYYRVLVGDFLRNLSLDTLVAMAGPWFSPAKSIFLLAPMLLLALIPSPEHQDRRIFQVAAFGFAFLIALAQALFYGSAWHGGYGWGPRFMLPALPALAVAAGFTLQRWWLRAGWRKIAGASLLSAGLVLQQAASWVPWRWSYQQMQAAGINPLANLSVWSLKSISPLWQLTGLFSWGAYDTAWLRVLWQGEPRALLIPMYCLLTCLSIALLVALDQSRLDKRMFDRAKSAIFIAALAGPMLAVGLIRGDPALADNRQHFHVALAELESQLSEEDAVVLDAYGTSLWHFMMNRWALPTTWYSLPYEVPTINDLADGNSEPAAATVDLFNRLLSQKKEVYYLTTSEVPDFSLGREVRWLRANAKQLMVHQFDGEPALYLYAFQLD